MTEPKRNLHALDLLGADFSEALSTEAETRRPRRRRRLQLALAAGLALLAIAVLLPHILSDSPFHATNANADLADTAAGIPPPPARSFAYTDSYLITTDSATIGPHPRLAPSVAVRQQIWVSASRQGRIEVTHLTPPMAGRTTSFPLHPSSVVQAGSESFKLSELEAGGDSTAKLVAALRRTGNRGTPAQAAEARWGATIIQLGPLAPVLPGETRAALIRELISIPGVKLVSKGDGEQAYELVALGQKNAATFSTATATLLKSSTVVENPKLDMLPFAPKGTILGSYQLRHIAQVKEVGQTGNPKN